MGERKIKVLVIEDDEYSRDALAHLLAAEGYEAELADDGESGLAKAREMNPDIIVLDLSLPGIDGKRVIKMIRSNQTLSSTPILVVTGHSDTEAQSAVDLGADAYLTKPVEFDELTRAIAELSAQPTASERTQEPAPRG